LNDLIASTPDPDLARELDRTRSILGALLDLHWEDSLYNQLDAEGRYNNTFLALTALVKAECLRQPLVLFVDDLQFIDTDSLAFLSRLKHSLSAVQDRYPVAILLAFRKQGSDLEMIANLLDADIELSGISRADLVRLVEIELGGPASPDLLEVTMSRSEGNPYFAGQIIRYLQEQDLLEMSNTGWRQIKRGRSALLPEDISALLIARLDRLAQKVKTVVQTASVLGREFEIRVLSEMLRHAPDVDECISEAEKASIWFLLREMRYIFQHALLRDAAYSMQMRARRQELHVLALGALERIHAGDVESHYAELAYHAENGDVRSKAQQYYTLAGRYAAGLYQNNQAVDYLTRALAYTPFDDVTTQFDLVAERVELFSRMGKRDLQIKDIESLGEWAKQLGDGNRLGQVLVLRAFYHHAMGQYLEAADCAQQAKSHLSSDIFPELVVRIQNLWASSLLRLGRNDEAMLQALSGLAIARSLGLRVDEGRMLTVMGLIALEQKDPSLAHQYLEESLTLARALKERRLESYAVNNLALSEGAVRGNYVLAGEYYQQAYALAKEVGDRYQEGIALTNMGFAAGLRGDLSLAFLYHEQALLVAREIGNINQEAYTLINLSAIAGINKEPDRAIDFAIQAHEISRNIHDRSAEAWAQLYMGHAYATLQKYSDARDAFNRSIDLRSELGQPSLSMEPLAGLVEVALLAGDIPSASRQVERILSYLGNGGSLDGTDEPLRVYHACYNFLEKQKDPRAWLVLQTANQVLEAQVSKFKDERSRKSFVENFPWRKAISSASKPK
jgi:tetratricopeptide (TPR) repeat protein